MAIVSSTSTTVTTSTGNSGTWAMYYIKDWLITSLGYVCRGSNDGTTAAFDGVDRINTTVANAGLLNRWIVLEDPGGKFQLCIASGSSTGSSNTIKFNPITNSGPAYSGGSTSTLPTAARELAVTVNNTLLTASITGRLIFTGQNTSPYGFAILTKTSGGAVPSSIIAGLAMVPFDSQPGTPGCPYWFFTSMGNATAFQYTTAELANIATTSTSGHGVMQLHSTTGSMPTSAPVGAACWGYHQGGSTALFPNGMGQDNSRDQRIPIMIGIQGSAYCGYTTFMQWNGTSRNTLDTYDSLSRIVFGHVNFPWDGVTTPIL